MVRCVVAILTLFGVQATAWAQAGPPDSATCRGHEANRDLYFTVLKVIFNERQIDRAEEFFTPDFVNHSAPKIPGVAQGPAAVRQYLPLLAKAFPDRRIIHDFVLCDGDYVVAHTFVTGTHTGPYFGRPPTGRSFRVTGTDVYKIRDGKIAARWGNEDALGLERQIGVATGPEMKLVAPGESAPP